MSDIFVLFKKISEDKEKSAAPEFIIAGLGNPGEKYSRTRHNAGFLAADYISQKCGVQLKKLKFKSLCTNARIGEHSVLLLKPETFMNNSGEAIAEAASFYKIPPEKVIVISDDICQAPGRMRIRKSGSAGGHNGLKSIIACLGSENFMRIRIGVGEKPHPEYDLADWVLGQFSRDDMEKLFKIFESVYEACLMLLDGKCDDAMGKFNGIKF